MAGASGHRRIIRAARACEGLRKVIRRPARIPGRFLEPGARTRAVVPDHAAVIGMERGAAMAGEGRRAKTGWAGVAAVAALALEGCGDGGVAGPEDARAADPASPGTIGRAHV